MALAAAVLLAVARGALADDLACRQAVGRDGARLLKKEVAILRACEHRRLTTPALVCPEPVDTIRLDRARAAARAGIGGRCAAPLPPELPTTCPAPCGASVTDGTTLANCVVCLADAAAADFVALLYPSAPAVTSCAALPQPPASCVTSQDCPAAYGCVAGECRAGACVVRADCPAGGQCVHVGADPQGTCVCRGCGPSDCTLGCTVGGVITGCLCVEEGDCPPEDDVCFLGVCS
jgi:hypothetical protein